MKMDRNFIALLVSSAVMLISLVGVAWYKSTMNTPLEITAKADPDTTCDISSTACSLTINHIGKVNLSITPRPIPLVTELSLIVKTDLKDVKQVMVDFIGTDMEMGLNQVMLKKDEQGNYSGKGMLPVCIRYTMNWRASVYIETETGLYVAPYDFKTQR